MKVGDLIKHKWVAGAGIVTKIIRNGPPGFPAYVTALWCGNWPVELVNIDPQYLEVISESR